MTNAATDDALRAAWDRGYATAVEGMKGVAASAWDEGHASCLLDPFRLDGNPYRSDQ